MIRPLKKQLIHNQNSMNKSIFNIFSMKSIFTVLLTVIAVGVTAQQKDTFRGKVTDAATGQGISAAQVSIPDKNASAVTDETGAFEIKITSANDMMQVSAIGYDKRVIGMQGRTSADIQLYRKGFTPYFKQVHDLHGSIDLPEASSSIHGITTSDLSSALVADEILMRQIGASGRQVMRSGADGMGTNLFIRGMNSLNATAQPLYVVDGIIWDNMQNVNSIHGGHFSNPLDNIPVDDIASVSILKDGTSIYGSKAANGVVVITTKRASTMVTRINLKAFVSTTQAPGSVPMMNGDDFRIYASDMLGSTGVTPAQAENAGFLITDPTHALYPVYHNSTDWKKLVYQPGFTQNYLINVTGGDEKALYYFSIGLADSKGVVKSTDWNRINSRFNADFNLGSKLNLGLSIGFTRNERSLIDDGIDRYSSPTWQATLKSPFMSQFSFTNQGEITKNPATTDIFDIGNPAALIRYSQNFQKKYRFNISVLPEWNILPDLKLSSMFDYSLYKTIEGHFVPEKFTPMRFLYNKGFSENMISSQVMRNTNIFSNTYLTYTKAFDLQHRFKAIAGLRYIYNYLESDYAEEHNSGSNNNTTITGAYDFLYVDGLNVETKSISNYYQAEYAYDQRYFLTASVALDASSRFGRNTSGGINGVGIFPAVNGAWLVSSENFMSNLTPVSFLKLRAGYGLSGNDDIRDYESQTYFNSVRFIDRANGLVLSNIGNTRVQWETTARVNAGMDIGLFNDRLNIQADVFHSTTSDLLTLQPLPEITGLGFYWANGGSMTNTGWEAAAQLKVINTRTFQWELGVSAGSYVNEVQSLPNDKPIVTARYGGELITQVGSPYASFYGYKTEGVFKTKELAEASGLKKLMPDGTYAPFGAGDMIFTEVAKDGIIDEKDRQLIGSPVPTLYGNFNTRFNYKRLSLDAVFTYSYGNEVYNYYRRNLESGSDFSNQTLAMLRRWTGEGQSTEIPRAVFGDPMENSRFSDRWIEDGSYLRFKNLTISYELPMSSEFIEGLSVWASAENIYTWSSYLGVDPEVAAGNSVFDQGIDIGLLPPTRSFSLGVKINL